VTRNPGVPRDFLGKGLLLLATAVASACDDADPPEPLGATAHTCVCDCERCVRRDPTTGMCVETARTETRPAICSDDTCSGTTADALAKCTEACERTADGCNVSLDGCEANFCSETASSSSPLLASVDARGSSLTLDPALSMMIVTLEDESAATSVSGEIELFGGLCGGQSCLAEVTLMRLAAANFDFAGKSVTDAKLINSGSIETTLSPSGTGIVDPNSVELFIKFNFDGTLSGIELSPSAPISVTVDEAAGTLTMIASGQGPEGVLVDLLLVSHFENRPPVTDAGPDQVVECDDSGAGTEVLVSAAGTTDPDGPGDIALFSWFTGFDTAAETPIGFGEQATLLLPVGENQITAFSQDASGAHDTDELVLSVVDTLPPTVPESELRLVYQDVIRSYFAEEGYGVAPESTTVALTDCVGTDVVVDQCSGELALDDHATIERVEMWVPRTGAYPGAHERKLKLLRLHPFFRERHCAGFGPAGGDFDIPIGNPPLPPLDYRVVFDVADAHGNVAAGASCTTRMLSELPAPGPEPTEPAPATCVLCVGNACPAECGSFASVCSP
jgi:hypothetical protein